MSKPFYATLKDRGLIHIEGEDRKTFLQGLVSNDVSKAHPHRPVYACLLTPQGKFLHDFFVHDGDRFLLIDCEGGARAKDLYERLLKFRLRAKVTLSVEERVPVYAVFGAEDGVPDPRREALGRRSFEKPDLEEQSFETWDQIRIRACVPDGSRDMEIERSTLLECHIDTLNGVDWNKGCYMGQELTARMHYRGLAKKHLYTVRTDDAFPAPFTDLPNGGSMRSSSSGVGIALLRDEDVQTFNYGHISVAA